MPLIPELKLFHVELVTVVFQEKDHIQDNGWSIYIQHELWNELFLSLSSFIFFALANVKMSLHILGTH